MKVLVAGGTGFIGTPLCRSLAQQGHELLVLTRAPERQRSPSAAIRFLSWESDAWRRALGGTAAVVNLAGEPLIGRRWSPSQKAKLRESRVQATRRIVEAIASATPARPAVLVNASAIGYYGPHEDEELHETDAPGRGFLAELCEQWEEEAQRAEALGVRVVRLRLGLVLSRDGGALASMVPPFYWFVGGPLGSGRQWGSWVHRDDVIGLVEWALAHEAVTGAMNATAPAPVTMRSFCRELGQILRRPSWAPAPGFMLRAMLGEMAEMVLTGQRVLPTAVRASGFTFRYPELPGALDACLRAA